MHKHSQKVMLGPEPSRGGKKGKSLRSDSQDGIPIREN